MEHAPLVFCAFWAVFFHFFSAFVGNRFLSSPFQVRGARGTLTFSGSQFCYEPHLFFCRLPPKKFRLPPAVARSFASRRGRFVFETSPACGFLSILRSPRPPVCFSYAQNAHFFSRYMPLTITRIELIEVFASQPS